MLRWSQGKQQQQQIVSSLLFSFQVYLHRLSVGAGVGAGAGADEPPAPQGGHGRIRGRLQGAQRPVQCR